jgi:AraC-like DNA-binding protein
MASGGGDSRADPAGGGTRAHGAAHRRRIADRLGTRSWTLQRHLADQGVSLRAIVEGSRLEIARVLLGKTELDGLEIAARTGYSTPSGLARAFARWTGCSPRQYRRAGGRLARE